MGSEPVLKVLAIKLCPEVVCYKNATMDVSIGYDVATGELPGIEEELVQKGKRPQSRGSSAAVTMATLLVIFTAG